MIVRKMTCVVLGMLILSCGNIFAQSVYSVTHYHNEKEIQQFLKEMQQEHQEKIRLHIIASSPGGKPVSVLEIGSNLEDVPAIFVGANFEGNVPLATEGALRLVEMLMDSTEYTSALKWYILPLPNPDVANNFFSEVKYGRTANDFEINNDADEAVNEDGFDDLNGDGFITRMRIKSLDGTHYISKADPRIMVKADAARGERGEYKMYSEGIDNDNDGNYNEDGEGGINPGISFPHLFPEKKKEAGLWPGQTPEVYNTLRFIYNHPEIAMVFTLGSSDFCLSPPKKGRKGDPDFNRIKLPGQLARSLSADENQTYTLDEVVKMMKDYVPAGTEVTPQIVAGMLELGAAVNPLDEDLKFYSEFSDEYKKYLHSRDFSTDNLSPEPAKDGSFELWAYYHLGVPSFSMNLFSVPLETEEKTNEENVPSVEEVEKMTADEFLALDKAKIIGLIKTYNATDYFSAFKLMEIIKSGELTPEQLVEKLRNIPQPRQENKLMEKEKALLAWSDKNLNGNGFAKWQSFNHPQLGEMEIGGFLPYITSTPKAEDIDSLLNIQLPWLLQLTKKMPQISFAGEELVEMGAEIYRVNLYIENTGQLPYPIAMGQRNSQPAPLVVVLDGNFELLDGLQRTPLKHIGANQVRKISWLIKAGSKDVITAKIESAVFPEQVKHIKTGDRL